MLHTIGIDELLGLATATQLSHDLNSKDMEQQEVSNKQEGLTPDIVSKTMALSILAKQKSERDRQAIMTTVNHGMRMASRILSHNFRMMAI